MVPPTACPRSTAELRASTPWVAAGGSATALAAAPLGPEEKIGTLAPGFEAALSVVEGNPSEDITALRRVVFVMRGGVVYRNDASRYSSRSR